MTELGTAAPAPEPAPKTASEPAPAVKTVEAHVGAVTPAGTSTTFKGVLPVSPVTVIASDASKLLTPKVRKLLYPIAGAIGAASSALAPLWPGVTGQVLDAVAAACTALVAGVAVSHI